MYIHEAIAARTTRKPFLSRKSWSALTGNPADAAAWIQPTNAPCGCIVYTDLGAAAMPGWNPSLDDLIANDWEPVGL